MRAVLRTKIELPPLRRQRVRRERLVRRLEEGAIVAARSAVHDNDDGRGGIAKGLVYWRCAR